MDVWKQKSEKIELKSAFQDAINSEKARYSDKFPSKREET